MARPHNHRTDHGLTEDPFHTLVGRDPPRRTDRRFETILALLDDGVAVLRNDGHITYTNPAAMRLVGLGPEHRVGDFARRTASLANL